MSTLKHSPYMTKYYKFLIMVVDFITLFVCFGLVHFLRFDQIDLAFFTNIELWASSALTLISFYIFGCYELDSGTTVLQIVRNTIAALVLSQLIIVFANYFLALNRTDFFGRGILIGGALIFGFVTVTKRVIAVHFFRSLSAAHKWLFLVDDDKMDALANDYLSKNLTGEVVYRKTSDFTTNPSSFEKLIEEKWRAIVCVTDFSKMSTDLESRFVYAKLSGHNIMDYAGFSEQYLGKVPINFLKVEWFITAPRFTLLNDPIGLRLKRIGDLVFSSLLILITWPLMILTAVCVRLESRGPAVFKQVRSGKYNKDFVLYKFRSMRIDAEKDGAMWSVENDLRVTKVGQFIRATRLDELPQLINVFKGEMSFIGPRPERPVFNEQLEKTIPHYNLRHLVRPGLTGWAQVSFPYGSTVDDSREKLKFDLYYIKHYSVMLDLIILIKTVRVVINRLGR